LKCEVESVTMRPTREEVKERERRRED